MKLFLQELETMAIGARLIVDTPIKNEKIMNYLHDNVKYNSDNKDIFTKINPVPKDSRTVSAYSGGRFLQ